MSTMKFSPDPVVDTATLTHEDVTTWIVHTLHTRPPRIRGAWIMRGPTLCGFAIKVVIRPPGVFVFSFFQYRTRHPFVDGEMCGSRSTRGHYTFHNLARNCACLPENKAAINRRARQPVINVRLHKEILSQFSPQLKVDRIVLILFQRNCCRNGNICVVLFSPLLRHRSNSVTR